MAVITMPDTLACAQGCALELVDTDTATRSDPSASIQVRFYGAPVWAMQLVSPGVLDDRQAGEWKALGLRLRGMKNHLAAYDPSRPYPRGSLRGALSLSTAAAVGDAQIVLAAGAGQAGRTIVPGDLLGVGQGLGTSQLVAAVEGAAVDGAGVITIQVEPPLLQSFPVGTVVVWDRPRVYMRRTEPRFGWSARNAEFTKQMRLPLIESP